MPRPISLHHGMRRGSILIVVAGMSALLATLALAFYARMRGDVEESAITMRESQARIMLMAACSYIQEASRIGWETGAQHEETFGWIDVRDGSIGPKITVDEPSDGRRFPIGTARRFPMHALARPPYAVQLTAVYNPIRTPISPDPLPVGDALFGMPYLTRPDPQPVVDNGWTGIPGAAVGAANFAGANGYAAGDPKPRSGSTGKAWFRLYRESGARFIVTCGGGGTMGYRDWANEVAPDPQARAQFGGDPRLFAELAANEVRLWYRLEWNAACLALDYHMMDHSLGRDVDHYVVWPPNASHSTAGHEYRTQMHARNMGGTILWVQRLREAPTNW